MESDAVSNLMPERWGSPLVQEKYRGEMACDKIQHSSSSNIKPQQPHSSPPSRQVKNQRRRDENPLLLFVAILCHRVLISPRTSNSELHAKCVPPPSSTQDLGATFLLRKQNTLLFTSFLFLGLSKPSCLLVCLELTSADIRCTSSSFLTLPSFMGHTPNAELHPLKECVHFCSTVITLFYVLREG
jgi:hypothetical protein